MTGETLAACFFNAFLRKPMWHRLAARYGFHSRDLPRGSITTVSGALIGDRETFRP